MRSIEHTPLASPSSQIPRRPARHTRFAQMGLGLVIALAILIGAWFVSGRAGLETVGRGGVNQRLLPKVGQLAPDFTTHDLYGNPVRLSQFRGHPVWLMFWGSWCPPCRAEFPDVEQAYEQLEPAGVQLLGVSVRESPLEAAAYAGENKASFLILSDPNETDTGQSYPLFQRSDAHLYRRQWRPSDRSSLSDMSEERALKEARALLEPIRLQSIMGPGTRTSPGTVRAPFPCSHTEPG